MSVVKLKKIIISSIAFCSLMTIGNVSATITSTQLEQIIPTSDLKFHNCVLDTYNSNYNSSEDHATIEQIKTNLSNITELSCESRQISSIEGIQFLTGLEKLNLSLFKQSLVGRLSGGQSRRLDIAVQLFFQ